MLSLKSRQDGFRLLFPKEFLHEEIIKKYTEILIKKHSFITNPIDFLNETIQGVQILGFQEATVPQQQTGRGNFSRNMPSRIRENNFLHTSTEFNYRSEVNPLQLVDKTLNVIFRHTLGFINYFMLFENFMIQYERDTDNTELIPNLFIDVIDSKGCVYCRVRLDFPLINSMDMLDLTYTNPIAQSQTFQVVFKYSNFAIDFIDGTSEHYPDVQLSAML